MARNKNFKIEKKWIIKPPSKTKLALNDVNPIVAEILAKRGFDEDEARDFIFPDYARLADPFELKGMREAVKVITEVINSKERIAVYGDYDVDGVSGTAILVRFFDAIGADVLSYIPSREGEGYGLNIQAIDELAKKNVKLIITTDCGTNAEEEIKYCHKLRIKIVITDHHEPKELSYLPEALVNPKTQEGTAFTDLAGAGVAFYLVRALQPVFQDKFPAGQEKWLLDLAALGTICDIVPLRRDNRLLAKFGLVVMSKSRNVGLKALANAAGFELDNADSYKIGFLIGPRLNAAGRLEHAKKSLKLLTTDNMDEATVIANELNTLNEERQEITERIVREAREVINSMDHKRKIYLLKSANWPAGVVGIAASRLVEEYGRPVLVMEDTGEFLKGSARSIKGFDIVKALSTCEECLTKFGGHAAAAGFTLDSDHFILLDEKLVSITDSQIQTTDLVPEIVADLELSPEDISIRMVRELALLEPFGPENPKPVFLMEELTVKKVQLVGNPKVHLKLTFTKDNHEFGGIAFNYGEECGINIGDKISLAATLEVNEWNGQKRIDFHLIDIKVHKKVEQNVDRTIAHKSE